ncbi:MAG: aminotransferase class V-fold PLP-dependent enzyme [Holophaga sp.]|jgi:selenocysteine lyase/cysteine desulfurase
MTTPALEPKFLAPSLLAEVRSRFAHVEACPYYGPRIFLDSASGSLRLKSLMAVAERELLLPDQFNRLTPGSKHCVEVKQRGEADVRLFLGAKSGVIVPSRSSTEGLFRLIRHAAAHWPGTNVVATLLDHPCTYDGTRLAAEAGGKEWRVAPLNPVTGFIDIEAILARVDRNTSVLAFIHASNITGALMDAGEIVRQARRIKDDLCIIVDGVQYSPHAPIDVEAIGADAYLFGGYKTYTRRGISFAHLSERMATIPHDKVSGKAADEWAVGSQDHFDYASWSVVAEYLDWFGVHFTPSSDPRERIVAGMLAMEAHELALLRLLLFGNGTQKGLKQMEHVAIYGVPDDLTRRCCLLPFNIKGTDSADAVTRYMQRGIFVNNRKSAMSKHMLDGLGAGAGIVRLSAAHYTSPADIETFLKVTETIRG